ncbi:MAG: carboxypeptidase regulatory-like domain-containing protein [Chloroflexota bacterium]|nr:carboxypeptidase regulatory-like domain-containing protein [Chloroflexota bacterium]
MKIYKRHFIGLAAVGLFLAALTLALTLGSLPVAAEPGPITGPAIRATPDAIRDQPGPNEPDPAYTTFVVQYQGQTASPELMRELSNLQTAGQVAAIDAASAAGRIFVLGDETAILALRETPSVVAITRADARPAADQPADPLAPQERETAFPTHFTERISKQEPRHGTFYPALDPILPTPGRDRPAARLPDPRATESATTHAGATHLPYLPFPRDERGDEREQHTAGILGIAANGFITGVVTGDDGGAPIAGVGVSAYQYSPYVYESTTTDASGVYSISVPAGSYRVEFYPSDYHVSEYYDDVPYSTPGDYTPVVVSDDTVTPNINASLAPGAQIIGRVTDQTTTSPLAGIDIDVSDPNGGYYYAYDYTGSDGVYTTTPGLPAGSYRVQFTDYAGVYATEYYTNVYQPSLATLLNVTSTNRTGIDAVLSGAALITGTVTGPGPLDGIRVRAYHAGEYVHANSDTTDAAGNYRLAGMGPVSYKLQFRDDTGQNLSEWHQDKSDWDTADAITLTSGMTTTVNAQLTQAGIISGTVTAEGSGTPLSDIDVDVYDATTSNWIGDDDSDSSGLYRIGGLAAGNYKLRFRDNNGIYLTEYHENKPDLDSGDPVTVTAGMTTTVNAQLTPAGVISGTITAEGSGTPLSNIDVDVYDATTDDWVGNDDSDSSGLYRIGGLAAGNYKLAFYDYSGAYLPEYHENKPDLDSGDPVTVTAGVTTTVNAQLTPAGVVSGVVTAEGSGTPLSDIGVDVYDAATGSYVNSDSTDSSGIYRIGGLEAGNYKLAFYDYSGTYLTEYHENKPDFDSGDPVTVTAGVTVTINAQLTPAGVISGVVTAEGSGTPLSNIDVDVYDATTGNWIGSDDSDSSGLYRVGGLGAGNYKLAFYDYSGTYLSEYHENKPDFDSGDPVTVTAGVTTTVNAQLTLAGVISGVVTAEGSGTPLSDIDVDVYDATTGNWIGDDDSDSSGLYRIGGLAAGNYKLRFRDHSGAYLTEYHADKLSLDSGDPVTVTAGMTTTVNAQLTPAGVISGVVTAEGSGTPLGDIDVDVYDATTGNWIGDDDSDSSGLYRIGGLAAGNYKLCFRDHSGAYLTEYHADKPDLDSGDPVTVTAGMTTTVNAQLTLAGVISGVVTAEGSGTPLGDIDVDVYDATTGYRISDDDSDSSGIYRIGGLAAGNYKLRFRDHSGDYLTEYHADKPDLDSGDPVTVTTGMTTTVNAQLSPAGVISGVVTAEGSGTPLSDIDVDVYDAATGDWIGDDDSDSSGLYRIGGLAAGNYKLCFRDHSGAYLTEYHADKPSLDSGDPVTVTAGMTTTVNAALTRGGRITGRVTDANSASGIAGVSVRAERQDGDTPDGSATTNANGYYTTTALHTGVYQVRFSPPRPYHSEYYDNFRSGYGFTPVTVTTPLTRTNVDAALQAGCLISGTVTGSGPLNNVSVRAYRGDDSYYVASASTGSDGTYQLGPLDPGQYRVRFVPPDLHAEEWYSGSASYAGATPINLVANLGNVNANLTGGGRITGTITGSGGAPLEGLWVYIYPAGNSSSIASGLTDANGQYATSPGLATGAYQVQFSAPAGYTAEWYDNQASQTSATVVEVTAGVTRTNVNAELTAYASGAITGTITAADTGLPLSMWVYAYDPDGDSVGSVYASGGTYVLRSLPPDTYRLRFSSPSPYVQIYYDDQPDLASADPVTVTAGVTTTNINQTIPRGGIITGTVTGSGGVPGVYVYARRVVGGYATKSTYTGVDGTYRLDGLKAGGYKVQFSPPAPFIGEWYDDAPDQSSAQTISITLDATTPDIDAVLEVGGVITGVVLAADTGDPLPGAYVDVYSTTGAFIKGSIYANMDGRYQTPGLPAGDYNVYFGVGPWTYYRTEWYDDAPSRSTGLTVTVPVSGTTPNINAALYRGGTISGWAYSVPKGWLLNSVYVGVYSATTGSYVKYTYSNNGGFYQVNGLYTGPYKVYFSRDGYEQQWYSQTLDYATALTVTVNAPDDTPNVNAYLLYARGVYLPLVMRNTP